MPVEQLLPVSSPRTFLTTSRSSNYRAQANQEQLVRLATSGYTYVKLTLRFRVPFQLYIEMQSSQSL
jgi:hypothetical protein